MYLSGENPFSKGFSSIDTHKPLYVYYPFYFRIEAINSVT